MGCGAWLGDTRSALRKSIKINFCPETGHEVVPRGVADSDSKPAD